MSFFSLVVKNNNLSSIYNFSHRPPIAFQRRPNARNNENVEKPCSRVKDGLLSWEGRGGVLNLAFSVERYREIKTKREKEKRERKKERMRERDREIKKDRNKV